jgi:hypothetical protein
MVYNYRFYVRKPVFKRSSEDIKEGVLDCSRFVSFPAYFLAYCGLIFYFYVLHVGEKGYILVRLAWVGVVEELFSFYQEVYVLPSLE